MYWYSRQWWRVDCSTDKKINCSTVAMTRSKSQSGVIQSQSQISGMERHVQQTIHIIQATVKTTYQQVTRKSIYISLSPL